MSTHQPPSDAVRNPAASADRALATFDRLVWRNPEVCANCFAHVRKRTSGEVHKPNGAVVEIDDSWRTPAAFLGEDLEDPADSVVGVKPIARPRTTCLECGSVGAIPQFDTLSRREALARVDALVARVEAQGHAVDAATVRGVVRHLKSTADYHANDKRVFAVALAKGLEAADR